MFSSFRRKQRRADPESPLRPSPSLPNLAASEQVFTWPDELVDNEAIRQAMLSKPDRKSSHAEESTLPAAIPFHKPFKGKPVGPISSIYMANTPPSTLDNWKTSPAPIPKRYTQRRARIPPSFNLMVVGGRGTGKTSLLRLILETAELSPTASTDQRAAVDRFLHGSNKRTREISTACVEILESRYDRCLLTVIDTPGLDFMEGRELKLTRQVNGIIKYIDTQFADTMNEESKVVRESKGDQHIHCCIYMIDHTTIMTAAARRDQSSLPKTHSQVTVSQHPPDLVPDTSDGDDSDDEEQSQLNMSPAELRVMKRLVSQVNIIPVIAHADSLTDSKLIQVKDAIRRGMAEIGLGDGVLEAFGDVIQHTHASREDEVDTSVQSHNTSPSSESSFSHEEPSFEEERPSRSVIKLRPARHPSARASSRSRSRFRDGHRPQPVDTEEGESIANIRFSAHILAQSELSTLVPFAFIAPETGRLRPERNMNVKIGSPSTDDSHGSAFIATSPGNMKKGDYVPPEVLKGVFLRKFRWGMVDVLNPEHCDFAALRNTIFHTHFKVLKTHTREVLYEKYRTEKLLARRATENISEEAKQRLLEDLGI